MIAADKLVRTMVTPEGLALPIRVGARGSRAGALMLDVTIIAGSIIAFNYALYWIIPPRPRAGRRSFSRFSW
jgi:hypothetical protein